MSEEQRKRQEEFLFATDVEYLVATRRFTMPNPNLACLMEEVGELARAMLEKKGQEAIFQEAVQVAAMAMRCALQGDPQFMEAKDASV